MIIRRNIKSLSPIRSSHVARLQQVTWLNQLIHKRLVSYRRGAVRIFFSESNQMTRLSKSHNYTAINLQLICNVMYLILFKRFSLRQNQRHYVKQSCIRQIITSLLVFTEWISWFASATIPQAWIRWIKSNCSAQQK